MGVAVAEPMVKKKKVFDLGAGILRENVHLMPRYGNEIFGEGLNGDGGSDDGIANPVDIRVELQIQPRGGPTVNSPGCGSTLLTNRPWV